MSDNHAAIDEQINRVVSALESNNITVKVVQNGDEASDLIEQIIPDGAEVMTMTSVTLDTLGVAEKLNSEKYDSVKGKLSSMSRETHGRQMQQIGAAPEWAVGSVHAVTEDGKVVIASNTGSQLPAYAYGAEHVVWVVGVQKIVSNLDEAMKRIDEYVLPLESERARKAYGVEGSYVSKLLIVNREVKKDRVTMILVKESLGY